MTAQERIGSDALARSRDSRTILWNLIYDLDGRDGFDNYHNPLDGQSVGEAMLIYLTAKVSEARGTRVRRDVVRTWLDDMDLWSPFPDAVAVEAAVNRPMCDMLWVGLSHEEYDSAMDLLSKDGLSWDQRERCECSVGSPDMVRLRDTVNARRARAAAKEGKGE